jgi:hypothetical protein
MLHSDGIGVSPRPVGSHGQDAKYEELVLPPKADYEGRYLQCFIPHRDEGFEIVVEYLDGLDMHDASTILVGTMFKPYVAGHAKNMPGGENVIGTEGGLQTWWLMGDGKLDGMHLLVSVIRSCNADNGSSSTPA